MVYILFDNIKQLVHLFKDTLPECLSHYAPNISTASDAAVRCYASETYGFSIQDEIDNARNHGVILCVHFAV